MIQIYHPDGTVEFVEENELYSSISSNGNTSPSTSSKRRSASPKVVSTAHTTIYNNEIAVGYVIQAFRNRNAYIGESEAYEYCQKVIPNLRQYFLDEVNKINAPYIAERELAEKRLLALKEIEQRRRVTFLTQKRSVTTKTTQQTNSLQKQKTKKNKSAEAKKKSSERAAITKLQNQLQEIKRQEVELKKSMLQCVKETGTPIQLGNFKISKLK